MNWQQAVERTVTGMGYELVECERGLRGLLSVSIDRVPGTVYPTGPADFVLVEDCEQVTRQLQRVLEVEGCDYARLEVSSPGLDRPLRRMADYVRFEGAEIDVTLRQVFQGRKKYRGILRLAGKDPDASLELIFRDGKDKDAQVLGFTLDEVREARLVPVVDFKGRGRKDKDAGAAAGEAAEQEPGGHEE